MLLSTVEPQEKYTYSQEKGEGNKGSWKQSQNRCKDACRIIWLWKLHLEREAIDSWVVWGKHD